MEGVGFMFKKLMASLGIGSAKVDTQLEKDHYHAGEEVRGQVVVTGGNTEQQIDRINLFLMTEVLREVDDRKVRENISVEQFVIAESFLLKEKEERIIPFSFILPNHAPATYGRLPVWFETGLDIPMALDPQDRDYIQVEPHPYVRAVLDAVSNELGFQLRKVEMESSRRHGIVQEYEYIPTTHFKSDLDELELVFFLNNHGLEVIMQVDRRAKGIGGLFAEALDLDENHVSVSFNNEELKVGLPAIVAKIEQSISRFI